MNFFDISYLKNGTVRQKAVFDAIHTLQILERLKSYSPVLVSTICIDIDIPESDLDVVCTTPSLIEFEAVLKKLFGSLPRFCLRSAHDDTTPHSLCNFESTGFVWEIYGSPLPVKSQRAYRHLVQASRVINIGGIAVKETLRALKLKGLKTEPAVAEVLDLKGDPYEAVLKLEKKSDSEIRKLLKLD